MAFQNEELERKIQMFMSFLNQVHATLLLVKAQTNGEESSDIWATDSEIRVPGFSLCRPRDRESLCKKRDTL